MKKTESTLLGTAIVTLLIFAYGVKTNRSWKYWVLSMLFMPAMGGYIGYALGKEDEVELCRQRECNDKGGFYNYGRCEGRSEFVEELGRFERPTIDLKRCQS